MDLARPSSTWTSMACENNSVGYGSKIKLNGIVISWMNRSPSTKPRDPFPDRDELRRCRSMRWNHCLHPRLWCRPENESNRDRRSPVSGSSARRSKSVGLSLVGWPSLVTKARERRRHCDSGADQVRIKALTLLLINSKLLIEFSLEINQLNEINRCIFFAARFYWCAKYVYMLVYGGE